MSIFFVVMKLNWFLLLLFFGSRNEIINGCAEEKVKMKRGVSERMRTAMHLLDENANEVILECLLNIQLLAN